MNDTEKRVDEIMRSVCETLATEEEASADQRNARAMYDHLCETLGELGYPDEVAEGVAATARDRLLELCGAGA